ncbi:MAG: hypothetical protein IT317_07270 [Anaerolineales bacterium]|nr:hypothetical protein [Anaerolineales bacterium]
MPGPIIQTKTFVPPLPAATVSRPRLIAQLNQGLENGHRLLLVAAPAGYGKTTLLCDWAGQAGPARVGWLALDEGDNDPAQFWTYLAGALGRYLPNLLEPIQTLLQGDPLRQLPTDLLLAVLINTLLPETQPIVLILDDYHVIHNERIHAALIQLLARAPAHLHLAVTSRSEPPLELSRLRARRQLTEIQMDALSFSTSESAAFLNAAMRLALSEADVAALNRRAEGWIAGLQLAAVAVQAVRRRADDVARFIQSFGGAHRHVMDYLTDEVLKHQPPEIQSFLLRTCLVAQLTAPLAEALTGASGAQSLLASLERANLFVIPLDSERRWYRYHSLWADMLRARLQREQPGLVPRLHQQASAWFEQNGLLDEAVSHALEAGDFERAAALLEPSAKALVMRGASETLQNRLAKLPRAVVARRPRLMIAWAWADVTAGQLDQAELVLAELAGHAGLEPVLSGEIAAIRAILATVRQDISAISAHAQQALSQIPLEDSQLRCVVLLSLGTAAALTGDVQRGVELLAQAVAESSRGRQPIIQLIAASTLAQAHEALGQFDQAEQLHRQVIALEADRSVGNLPLIGVGYVGLGGILHERLRFQEAEAALQRGLSIGQRWGSPEILIGGYISLARLRYTQGDLSAALEILARLESEFLDSSPAFERDLIRAMQARLWLAQGQVEQAEAWARPQPLDESEPVAYAQETQFLVLMRLLIARKEANRALPHLTRLEQTARSSRRASNLIEILILQALAQHALRQPQAAQNALGAALALAEPQNQRRVFVDEPEIMPLLPTQARPNSFAAGLLVDFERRAAALRPGAALLSGRELEVLRLMAAGLSNQAIADRLVVALSTVKSHVKSILMKLAADNRTGAVARARELHLL